MKTKNKILALVEIVIVCSMLLVALPVISAEQTTQGVSASANTITTASGDDFVLGIYGNANEDDTIDMRDVTYAKLVIFGKKTETELADAYYDDEVDVLDVVQIKLIILGRESELTIIDEVDRVVTVKKPLERIVSISCDFEVMRYLKLEKERIVGVSDCCEGKIFYPDYSDIPSVGDCHNPDIEAILSRDPDAVFMYYQYPDQIETLEDVGVTVMGFNLCNQIDYEEQVKKLGYIIGKEKETAEFLEFYEECMNTVEEKVADIPEDERTRVFFELYYPYYTFGKEYTLWQASIDAAGGNNIFSDISGGFVEVDHEEVVRRDPEVIVREYYYETGTADQVDDPTHFKSARDEIMSRLELADVSAVKDERVYIMDWTLIESPSHFIGIQYMAKWLYPELFIDLYPKATHQEYLTRFLSVDYDLDEHGVFVFPEPS